MRRSRRRVLLAAVALATGPVGVRGQSPARLPVLGILSWQMRPPPQFIADNPFSNRMRALGWVEGQTLVIERAYAQGREERLPDLAAGLVAKRVDVIWASGPQAALAALHATKTIPIVFWGVPYPVEQGLVTSLARPGGNVTGIAWTGGPELHAKRLQLLREIAPSIQRLAFLADLGSTRTSTGGQANLTVHASEAAARRLGVEMRSFAFESAEDVAQAFTAIRGWGADSLMVGGSSVAIRERHRIAAFANRYRMPSAYSEVEFAQAGGLVSFAIRVAPVLERSAHYVDRILRAARVAELPVELPTVYELAVNLRSAKALGLTIPQALLLRADKVFD
jgi:putative ABC transport system substrate-binding protein